MATIKNQCEGTERAIVDDILNGLINDSQPQPSGPQDPGTGKPLK